MSTPQTDASLDRMARRDDPNDHSVFAVFAINLAVGSAAKSQWSWHLQMVRPGRSRAGLQHC